MKKSIIWRVVEWIILIPVASVFCVVYFPFIVVGFAFALIFFALGGPNPLKNVDLNKTQGR